MNAVFQAISSLGRRFSRLLGRLFQLSNFTVKILVSKFKFAKLATWNQNDSSKPLVSQSSKQTIPVSQLSKQTIPVSQLSKQTIPVGQLPKQTIPVCQSSKQTIPVSRPAIWSYSVCRPAIWSYSGLPVIKPLLLWIKLLLWLKFVILITSHHSSVVRAAEKMG